MEIVLVLAVAENGVIGANGSIPWRLKSDMQRFKSLTIGKPIVMGRKTFVSLRRPLPHRTNIVMTRDQDFRAPGAIVTPSLAATQQVARGDALRRGTSEIAVIGGAEIYAQWMEIADRLEITEVRATPQGDTRMPPVDRAKWREVARTDHSPGADDSVGFSYVTYRRRAAH